VCDFDHALPPLEEDEYVLDTAHMHDFVGAVRARIDEARSPARELRDRLVGRAHGDDISVLVVRREDDA